MGGKQVVKKLYRICLTLLAEKEAGFFVFPITFNERHWPCDETKDDV